MNQMHKLLIVVEDNEEDIYALKRAFASSGEAIPILHFANGELAIEYFQSLNISDSNLNLVIMLDLNLPGLDGNSILKIIRDFPATKFAPIILFTSSVAINDIQMAYQNGATSFLKKSVNYIKFSEDILSLKDYWFNRNISPYTVFKEST